MALAVLLPVFGAAFNRRERLRPSRLASSSGLLMMGFFAAVVGVIAFFTAEVDESGGTVNISYPNPTGMPWIVGAAALWSVAGLMLRSRHLGESKIPAAIGLLVAGLVSLILADLVLGMTYLALLNVGAVEQGPDFVVTYPRIPPAALWLGASILLWVSFEEERRKVTETAGG